MKKLIALLMLAMICASLCACGDNNDTKNEATESTTQVSTTAEVTEPTTEKITEEVTQAPVEGSDEVETQAVTEAQAENNNAAFEDLEGLWKHSEKGDHNTLRVTCGANKTMYLSISAIRGEAAQVATCEVETVIENSMGTFTYEDSFGNKGDGQIVINGESLLLVVNETESANNWGIRASSGEYIR